MLEEKNIHFNDLQVSYLDEGSPTGFPLIFIHGFPFNKWMWEKQLIAIKENYRLIAYDVRGHGETEAGTPTFSISQFADDLIALMDALHIEKAIVAGLSMGGYIALNAIKKYSDRFAGLILCDTQCGADSAEGKEKRKKTIDFIKRNGLEVYAQESLKNLFAPASLEGKMNEVLFIEETILQSKADNICLTLQALADRMETCSSLKKIKVPVAILVGKEDKVTTSEIAEKLHELIKGSTLHIIDEAGHLSNLENPDSFNEYLLEFLKTNFGSQTSMSL
jgi:3-oxoadipate enol-lactonase